jgi:uncharacterized protein (TIGR04222 family)
VILLYQLNPFDLPGPLFLLLYIAMLAVACVLAFVLRKRAKASDHYPNLRGVSFDAYETAYLNGGPKLVIETAIATLVRSNALHLSFVDYTLSPVAGSPRVSHPFEQTIHRLVASREATTIKTIRAKAAIAASQIGERLKTLGLILDQQQTVTAQMLPLILFALVLLFGSIKLLIGFSRGRPIGFLFVLCLIAAFIAYRLYKSPPLRTTSGDSVLEALKQENAALGSTAKSQPQQLAAGDVSLAMALFGMTALAFTDQSWSELKKQIFPVSGGASTSSSSSCSSSSCGSSGSSGCGGGCGGGGCGGCGS